MRVEVCQSIQHALGDLAKDLLACSASKLLDLAVHCIERSAFAELHGDADSPCAVVHESTVVTADVVTGAVLVERQFSYDLLLDIGIGVRCDDLEYN